MCLQEAGSRDRMGREAKAWITLRPGRAPRGDEELGLKRERQQLLRRYKVIHCIHPWVQLQSARRAVVMDL